MGLQRTLRDLEAQGRELHRVVQANIDALSQYLDNCDDLFVGYGEEREYLLDICSQLDEACIDEPGSAHAACACAHHPFTTFTQVSSLHTIQGIREMKHHRERTRVRAGRRLRERAQEDGARRLESEVEVLFVCPKAWTDARAFVSEKLEGIARAENLTLETVSQRYGDRQRKRYGTRFCGFNAGEPSFFASESATTLPPASVSTSFSRPLSAVPLHPSAPVSTSNQSEASASCSARLVFSVLVSLVLVWV